MGPKVFFELASEWENLTYSEQQICQGAVRHDDLSDYTVEELESADAMLEHLEDEGVEVGKARTAIYETIQDLEREEAESEEDVA